MQVSCHLCLFSCSLGWITLEHGGGSPFVQNHIPWDSFKQDPEQTEVCCPGLWSFCLVHFSQDPELHHFMDTAARLLP